ncbi:hypothetical protein GR927_41205 [Mycolicibacterium sp. 3033]|nr:hypothetical protein [Mycolicibacterium aurantiacum]
MTTAQEFGSVVARPAGTVSIAGVPWPTYKVVALLVGLITFAIMGVIFSAAAPAVLIATGVATVLWAGGALRRSPSR